MDGKYMMSNLVDALIPLLVVIVGGPCALIFRIIYGKKDKKSDKFSNGGTYNRNDDAFYSNSDKSMTSDEDK